MFGLRHVFRGVDERGEALVGHRERVDPEGRDLDSADRGLAVAGIDVGVLAAHEEPASQERHKRVPSEEPGRRGPAASDGRDTRRDVRCASLTGGAEFRCHDRALLDVDVRRRIRCQPALTGQCDVITLQWSPPSPWPSSSSPRSICTVWTRPLKVLSTSG